MNGTWTQVVAVSGGFTAICVAVGWVIRIVTGIRKPNKDQNERLDKIEDDIAKIHEYLDRDNDRLNMLDEGNRVTQRALLALLSHGIDGNEVESMRKAKEELQEYLIRR